jgi:hypothetical protein
MTLHFRSKRPPTGLDRLRPNLTQPLSLDHALSALKTICAASRASTGGRPYNDPISPSTEHSLVSTLRQALVHAQVDAADVRVALLDVPRHAADAARARTHAKPSEAASRARRALRLLTGLQPAARKLEAPQLFMSAGFRELQQFAVRRGDRSKLVVVARTCAAMGGYDAPATMPTADELCAFAETAAAPYEYNSVRNAISAYRRIRSKAVATDPSCAERFATLERRPNRRSRVAPACRLNDETAALGTPARTLQIVERLRPTFPSIATELELYASRTAAQPATVAWLTTVQLAVLRIVSLLDALYGDPVLAGALPSRADVRLWHVYETMLPAQRTTSSAEADFLAGVGVLRRDTDLLMRRLMLDDAPHARRTSSLGGAAAENAQWLPQVCVRTECAIWSLLTSVYGRGAIDPTTWAAQAARREVVVNWLHESLPSVEERAGRGMDKRWLVTHLSLPLLQCVGVPWLSLRVRAARAEWQRRLAAEAPAQVCQEAYEVFARLLHDYCGLAIVCDDGMRRKNYVNGRHGTHVTTTYRDGRLVDVTIRYFPRRADPAGLKITERGGRQSRRPGRPVQPHVHQLSPATVDHELLDWWFREVEPGFSYRRPVVHPTLAPSADALHGRLLFPSAQRVEQPLRIGSTFAQRIALAMYDVIRFLHGDAVPPSRKDLPTPPRKACTLHRLRLLLAVYWGGVRDDWEYAEFLTSDLRSTLEEHYRAEIDAEMANLLQGASNDWRDPRYFNDLMDAMRARQPVNPLEDPRVQAMLRERNALTPRVEIGRRDRRWRRTRRQATHS